MLSGLCKQIRLVDTHRTQHVNSPTFEVAEEDAMGGCAWQCISSDLVMTAMLQLCLAISRGKALINGYVRDT